MDKQGLDKQGSTVIQYVFNAIDCWFNAQKTVQLKGNLMPARG